MIHSQFFVVPRQLTSHLGAYLLKHKALMRQVEDRDLRRRLEQSPRVSLIRLRSISDTLIKGFSISLGALLDTHGLAHANQRRTKELQKPTQVF